MFGRATIRLGIGPHSSFTFVFNDVLNRPSVASRCCLCTCVCVSVLQLRIELF